MGVRVDEGRECSFDPLLAILAIVYLVLLTRPLWGA